MVADALETQGQGCLIVTSHKVLKSQDFYLEFSRIFQAPQQHCFQCACQISKRFKHFNTRSRAFETLQDLTIRYLVRYWNRALVPKNVLLLNFQFTINTATITHPGLQWDGSYEYFTLKNDPLIKRLHFIIEISCVLWLNLIFIMLSSYCFGMGGSFQTDSKCYFLCVVNSFFSEVQSALMN